MDFKIFALLASSLILYSAGFKLDEIAPNELASENLESLVAVEQLIDSSSSTEPEECGEYQYKCKNGQCIDNEVVCDKEFDCTDLSDEGDICQSGSIRERRGYGEFCNKNLKCNSTIWLSCIENKCKCTKPDEMIFDPKQEQCISLVGEICKFEIGNIGDAIIYETVRCVDNADCSSDRKCFCVEGYQETREGLCKRKKDFGESCDKLNICMKPYFCGKDGTCTCDTDLSMWRAGTCVGLASKNCINSTCVDNAECLGNICQCKSDYYIDGGICSLKKYYSGVCVALKECREKEHLTCLNGKCECDPDYSVWDHNSNACIGKLEKNCIGGKCASNGYCFASEYQWTSWVANGYYQYDYENSNSYYRYYRNYILSDKTPLLRQGICKCRHPNNLMALPDGTKCVQAYDQSCSLTNPCYTELFTCKNNKCTCHSEYHQTYDSSKKICRSFPGGPCKSNSIQNDCIENAECKLDQFNITACSCKPGYVEGERGYCTKRGFGESCDGETCDDVAPLYCINGKCGCSDILSNYDESTRKCLRLVGARCSDNSECVSNSICKRSNLGIKGRCKCANGYATTTNRTCIDENEEL